MLIVNVKNNTTHEYDAIRKAAKAAFKNSNAYRQRQVTFDDAQKSNRIMGIKIGEPSSIDMVLNVELTSIDMLSKVVTAFEPDTAPGRVVAEAEPDDHPEVANSSPLV